MWQPDRERRNFFRYPIDILVEVQTLREGLATFSQACDISAAGIAFYWTWNLPQGHLIELAIPIGQKRYRLKAKVIYALEESRMWRFRIGAIFMDPTGSAQARLVEAFVEILKEPDGYPFPEEIPFFETVESNENPTILPGAMIAPKPSYDSGEEKIKRILRSETRQEDAGNR